MKNSKTLVIALCLMIVLGLTFTVAENSNKSPENKSFKIFKIFNKEKPNESGNINKSLEKRTNRSLENSRRANYGFCVSAQTKVRNYCYISEKQAHKTCERARREEFKQVNFSDSSVNKTLVKEQMKEKARLCREDYKDGLKECKVAFNSNKQACVVWRCQSNQTYGNGTCIKTA